jgi:hypothetical protein
MEWTKAYLNMLIILWEARVKDPIHCAGSHSNTQLNTLSRISAQKKIRTLLLIQIKRDKSRSESL